MTYPIEVPSCDRPGCSEPAFLHYGFDPASALVWLDALNDDQQTGLCREHAERLTPPRGWTIDDRRDPTLRLFRPGPEDLGSASKSRKRKSKKAPQRPQDSLFTRRNLDEPAKETSPLLSTSHDEPRAEERRAEADRAEKDLAEDGPAAADTSTLSPLLSRAFRGTSLAQD